MRVAILTLGLLIATEATALSCAKPDVATSYLQADEAEEIYVVMLGQFDFAPDALERLRADPANPESRVVEARFSGGLFTGANFSFEAELDVTIEAVCYGPFCASMAPGIETLAFVERGEAGYKLTVDPCGTSAFPDPDAAQLAQVVACYEGEDCVAFWER